MLIILLQGSPWFCLEEEYEYVKVSKQNHMTFWMNVFSIRTSKIENNIEKKALSVHTSLGLWIEASVMLALLSNFDLPILKSKWWLELMSLTNLRLVKKKYQCFYWTGNLKRASWTRKKFIFCYMQKTTLTGPINGQVSHTGNIQHLIWVPLDNCYPKTLRLFDVLPNFLVTTNEMKREN